MERGVVEPLRLQLRNARVFRELDLELPVGAVSITAPNGSGKSTLVNALDVALFGPESRSLADWLSEDSPDGTVSVTLVFEHEGEIYRARRTYNGKGRGVSKFELEHHDASEDPNPDPDRFVHYREWNKWEPMSVETQKSTQSVLEDLVGFNRETFRACSFISQGTLFCDLQPREQKRILGELLQLGQWDGWLEQARTQRRATESELDRIAGGLERAEAELAERPAIESARSEAQNRLQEAQGSLDAAAAALTRAREAVTEARAQAERRAGAEKAVQDAAEWLATLTAQIKGREAVIADLDKRLAKRDDLTEMADGLPGLQAEQETLRDAVAKWDERQRLLAEHKRLMDERDRLDEEIVSLHARAQLVLDNAGSETCDRCGQTLHLEAAQRAAQSYRDEADKLALDQNTIDQHSLVRVNEHISELPAGEPDRVRLAKLPEMIQARVTAGNLLAALDEALAHRQRAERDLQEMRAELPERDAAVATARAELEALVPHDPAALTTAEDYAYSVEEAERIERSRLDAMLQEIARLDERLARLEKIAADVKDAAVRRDTLHADLDVYAQMERACGPNGVPALILENVAIPQIETAANAILERFGSKALGVQLLTQREKKAGGLADTLQVNVLTEYGSRAYATFSTGEKLRINASITLGIAQLVAARSARTGILVIDDLGPLDSQGIAVLVDICNDLTEKVPRVYVISQSPELRDAFEQSIVIENVDGHSRIAGMAEPVPIVEEVA